MKRLECQKCYYFEINPRSISQGYCHRYPTEKEPGLEYWCGEFKTKKEKQN